MKILICGHRSYAARGLAEKLEAHGHEVWQFSRGSVAIDGHIVTGPVTEMDNNPYICRLHFDAAVNFILLDGQPVEDNLKYIDALCRWCERANVRRIVHISSISALPNDAKLINEDTPVDTHIELKGNYGAIKATTEKRLATWGRNHCDHEVVVIRAGFITATDKKNALGGIAKVLPFGFAVLMGNNKSTLPIIDREELHLAIIDAIESEKPLAVYLMTGEGIHTKKDYLKSVIPNAKVIPLSKSLTLLAAKVLKYLHVLDKRKYMMVTGQFKVQRFDNERTFKKIHLK